MTAGVACGTMIPRRIHLVWLGDAPPERLAGRPEEWRRLNPGWEVRVWGDADLAWLRNLDVFRAAGPASTRSNVARYEILLRDGGVYVDFDMRPLRPLDEVVDGRRLVLAEQTAGVLNPAFMAAEPGHGFLAHLVAQVPVSWAAHPGAKSPTTTGPHFLTRTWRRWSAAHGTEGAEVLEPHVVYPVNHLQGHLAGGDFPDSVAVHEWDGSWIPASASGRARASSVRSMAGRVLRRVRTAPSPPGGLGVTPVGDGRVLVPLRPGVALLGPQDLTLLASLAEGGTGGLAVVERIRSLVRHGDTVVQLGARDPLLAVVAGRAVARPGRVIVVAEDEPTASRIADAVAVDRRLGMKGHVEVLAPARWHERAEARARRWPEIGVLWVEAGSAACTLLAGLLPSVRRGEVRTVIAELDDGLDAAGWTSMARTLGGLVEAGGRLLRVSSTGTAPMPVEGLEQGESPLTVRLDRPESPHAG